jgi:competence protein ComFC
MDMQLLDIFFPKRCVGCGKTGRYFCPSCIRSIKTIQINESICPVCEKPAVDGMTHPKCRGRYTIDGLTSFFRYDGIVRKAVKAVKYRYISDSVKEFVSLIPQTSYNFINKNIITSNTIIVPIPLHPKRFSERGFNQAELLARQLSLRLNIPVDTKLLKRIKYTEPQVKMRKRIDRLKNMDGVFAVSQLSTINYPLSIILVDDVFTTGATMRTAAGVLKRSGLKFVWGITMAR